MPPFPVSRPVALALVGGLVALLVVAGQRLSQVGTTRAPEVVAPLEPVSTAPEAAARPVLVVHVVGAVRRPGLFRLPEGSRVADAVARAGGATRRAELAGLNLAAPLVDGIQVVVPSKVALGGPAGASSGAGLPPGSEAAPKVSLATATAEELDELPGVGPVTAQTIIDYRSEHGPFRSVDDLDAVPGIGPTRVEQLRELVTP